MVYGSGTLGLGGGAVAETAARIASAKVELGVADALVCLAIWLSMAAHTVAGKSIAIVFPISAFVALGFEHSVANMYLIPIGWLAGADGVTAAGFVGNLVPVTLGNIVGGSVFVALVYWVAYRQGRGDQP